MTNKVLRIMTILAIGAIASLISMAPMNASADAIWDFAADLTSEDADTYNPGHIDNGCGTAMANVWKYMDVNDDWVIEYEIMFMGNIVLVEKDDFPLPPPPPDFSGESLCYVTAMHIHNAALGSGDGNGPHMVNIYGLPGFDDGDVDIDLIQKKITGIYTSADATCTLPACAGGDTRPITDDFVEDLKNGDWYVAVHSVGNNIPDTEIRGFLEFVPKVGGEFLSIDSSALLLAGLQSSAIWMLPVLAGAAGTGAYFIRTRMNKD